MAASAGAAAAGYIEHLVDKTTSTVRSVLSSSNFNPVEIRESKFNLSQAYSLLWQDKESGEVKGRKMSEQKNCMAVAATILDLVVKGKIEVDVQPKSRLGISYDQNYVRVISDSPTESYLDVALFNKILKHLEDKPDDPYTLESLIRNALCKCDKSKSAATLSLDSLVEMGVLEKKEKNFILGLKYPTVDPGPEEDYVQQIRKIALDGAAPDSFMWTLLVLMRGADNFFSCSDPFLQRHFSKDEYKGAKERIKHLVDTKSGPGKYEAM